MKIKYMAPKGLRINKQFISLELDTQTTDDWISWWYYPESHEWRKGSDFKEGETHASSCCHCRSLKSAIRKIKKWNFPKGTAFRLCSIWMSHDVYITM